MTVDARPGGVFQTVMVNDADGTEYPTRAVYDEVRAPRHLGAGPRRTRACGCVAEFAELGPRRTECSIHQSRCPRRSWPGGPGRFLSSLDRSRRISAGWSPDEWRRMPPKMHGTPPSRTSTAPACRCSRLRPAGRLGCARHCARAGAPAKWWRTRDAGALRRAGLHGELEAGGDFTRLSDAVAARDGALPRWTLLADFAPRSARMGTTGRGRRGRTDPLRDPRGARHPKRCPWPAGARKPCLRTVLALVGKPTMGRTCSGSISATWRYGRTT